MVAQARAGRSVESLAREYEPCAATIHDWVKQAGADEGECDDRLGAALRPLFIIVGFVASLIIMRSGMDFLFLLFSGFLGSMTAGDSWFTVIILVGLVCMYVLVTLYLVIMASSLITELGDRALSLVGMLTERANTLNLEQNVVGTMAPTRTIANQAGRVGRLTRDQADQGARRLIRGPKSKDMRQRCKGMRIGSIIWARVGACAMCRPWYIRLTLP
ncbi:hypothetical protein IU397_03960 [Actibacterium sp. 188UL27-1]|nr:hypothetical protein [Actibacterium sp. 188UL27-1]